MFCAHAYTHMLTSLHVLRHTPRMLYFVPHVRHEEFHLLHLYYLYEFDLRSLTKGYSRQTLRY